MIKKILFLIFTLPVSLISFCQYNFSAGFPVVYNILNTKCSNAGCHSATSPDALKFDGNMATVYAEIFNQPPVNIAAQQRGEKLVWMDQPYQSYLLKKAGSWLDTDLGLPSGESDSAAHSQANTGLTNIEVEYIRQWIIDSAAQFTNNIDTAVINAYYTDTATSGPFSAKLAKPAAGAGLQLRFGPFFIRSASGQNQVEYLLMNKATFPTDVEATAINVQMTSFSHHFILNVLNDSADAMNDAKGLREVILNGSNTVSPFETDQTVVSVWLYSQNIVLPNQTAFFWSRNTYFDFDFHMLNYSTYSIMPFDAYVNIATRPRDVNDSMIEMKSRENSNNTLGHIDLYPPYHNNTIHAHTTSVCIDEDADNGSGNGGIVGNDSIRYIWMLNSHTHKMGVGFNIYNFDNTQTNDLGTDTIYNGFMSYNNPNGVVNLGYYDWEHPPVEYFPNFYPVNYKTSGLIAQTTYTNDSSFNQVFGLTTNQEMQFFYYLYVTTLPTATSTGVSSLTKTGFDFRIYPNPMAGHGTLSYTLDAPAIVNSSITDITGKQIAVLKDEKEQAGNYDIEITRSLPAGMYFARVNVNGENYTKKFVVE